MRGEASGEVCVFACVEVFGSVGVCAEWRVRGWVGLAAERDGRRQW